MTETTSDTARGMAETKVFISYSRKDRRFTDRLEAALKARDVEPLIDREDIYALEDWWKRIESLIASSDTVVFVLSPDAVDSEIALKEIAFAASLNKRFAPIVCRPVGDDRVPQALRRFNFIYFDDESRFENSADQLVEALTTDIDWIRKHTEIGEIARRWAEAGRPGPKGLLLRSPLLEEAERWIAARPQGAPPPTAEVQALIAESRRAATRGRNILSGGLAAGLVFALGLAWLAYWQRGIAQQNEARAIAGEKLAKDNEQRANSERDRALIGQSRLLGSLARAQLDAKDPVTAMLLAIEALPSIGGDAKRPYTPEPELSLYLAQRDSRELRVLGGPRNNVTFAAFSSDGRRIATTSVDRAARKSDARIWEAATGKEVAVLSGHMQPLFYVGFSPDGQRVVTASEDEPVRIWTGDTGKETTRLPVNGVVSVALSPNGQLVVTGSTDRTARVWDAGTGKELAVLRGALQKVYFVAFSPDGRRVVGLSDDRTVRLWDIETAKQIASIRQPVGFGFRKASFSPDGKHLLVASRAFEVKIFDSETLTSLLAIQDEQKIKEPTADFGAVYSPDGRRVVTGSSDRAPHIRDAQTGQAIATMKGHEGTIRSAIFSPDGRLVLTASSDRTARLWDADTGRELVTFKVGSESVWQSAHSYAEFSPDGRRVITTFDDGPARIWSVDAEKELAVLSGHRAGVRAARFSRDGKRIVTGSYDRTGRVWNAETGQLIAVLEGHPGSLAAVRFSPDGQRVVTVGGDDDTTTRVWDAETGRPISTLKLSALTAGGRPFVTDAVFSLDGRRVVTAEGPNVARVWNSETGEQVATLNNRATTMTRISKSAISEDARLVVTGGRRVAWVWSIEAGEPIAVLAGHDDLASESSFSPDGRYVAAESAGTIHVWDVEAKKQIAHLKVPGIRLSDAQFSQDGRRVGTGGSDGARVWNVEAGTEVAMVRHERWISSVVISPDGARLLTAPANPATGDAIVRVWRYFPTTQHLVAHAMSVVPRCLTRAQRERASIDPEPPAWCIEMEKWPYHSAEWKQWLRDTRAGKSSPLPPVQ